MPKALFVGRFQPFHKGHMKAVSDMLKECDMVIVCIGSAQESRTQQNPFTHKERAEMIKYALNDAEIPEKKYKIIPLTDINNESLWVGHVESHCPKFDIVYTGNHYVKKLFATNGYKVKEIPIFMNINSSKIRERMYLEKEWKKYVPNAVAYYLQDIDAPKLIRNLRGRKEE